MGTREYNLRKRYEKQLAKQAIIDETEWKKPQLDIPVSPKSDGLRHRNVTVSPV